VRVCSAAERVVAAQPDGIFSVAVLSKGAAKLGDPLLSLARWPLDDVTALCRGQQVRFVMDTGAGGTIISLAAARRAGLGIRPLAADSRTRVKTATGQLLTPVGETTVPLAVQLLIERGNAGHVHWDREFELDKVLVVDLGRASPRDLYIGYADWRIDMADPARSSPLGHLAWLVLSGHRILDLRRPPPPGTPDSSVPVLVGRRAVMRERSGSAAPDEAQADPLTVEQHREVLAAALQETAGAPDTAAGDAALMRRGAAPGSAGAAASQPGPRDGACAVETPQREQGRAVQAGCRWDSRPTPRCAAQRARVWMLA